jgi:hypothetical protein
MSMYDVNYSRGTRNLFRSNKNKLDTATRLQQRVPLVDYPSSYILEKSIVQLQFPADLPINAELRNDPVTYF